MTMFWRRGRSIIREVVGADRRKPGLARGAVPTMLRILEQRGCLRRENEERAFVHEPMVARNESLQSELPNLVSGFQQPAEAATQTRVDLLAFFLHCRWDSPSQEIYDPSKSPR